MSRCTDVPNKVISQHLKELIINIAIAKSVNIWQFHPQRDIESHSRWIYALFLFSLCAIKIRLLFFCPSLQ